MTKIMKRLVLTMLIVGMGTSAYALDLFTSSNTANEGLNGSDMRVTPSGAGLANAAIPATGPGDQDALKMMPESGNYQAGPGSGLRTDFNSTGVADAFGYNVAGSAFQFPVANGGAAPQGPGSDCPTCPAPPASPDQRRIDSLVSTYAASSGFAQNMHSSLIQTNTNGTQMSTHFTLEQGDRDLENNGGESTQVFKQNTQAVGGAEANPAPSIAGESQLVQQTGLDAGPFSSCFNCLQPQVANTAGISTFPFTQRTDTGPGFVADTVTHPGP